MSKASKARNSRSGSRNVVDSFKAQERKRNLITGSIIGLLALALVGGVVFSIVTGEVEPEAALIEPSSVTAEYGTVLNPSDLGADPALDDAVAAKIVIYEDFSCPFCKQFEESSNSTLENLVQEGQASIEYRTVGFLDAGPVVNNHSKRAGSAALCVRDDNGMEGWKTYHDWLYENQPNEGSAGQTNTQFIEGANDLDLTVDETCVKSERYVPWLQDATDKFNEDDIGGTPTIFVNDQKIQTDIGLVVQAVEAANSN